MNITQSFILDWLKQTKEKITLNKTYLTLLDETIGDGDHGINMVNGLTKTVHYLENHSFISVSHLLKECALSLMKNIGGAAGPLYGTAFLRMSFYLQQQDIISEKLFIEALEEAVKGMKKRGNAELGDKTMLDVWEPVIQRISTTQSLKADEIKEIAQEARDRTEHIIATKGRARYLKEKSIGSIDPGAASSYFLFEALSDVIAMEKGADKWQM